ncbi:calcium-dependent lipid-binding protein-like isoform X2 [Macadamia integrifolia]|uniref:calcium-dependent lipid-binding protein-like isoform X2 n=1 Tax=Macadamia integrifolia TaxID=60698 RepID=UPI001C4FB9F2|nr:calcium-dependent lipid-binding protein-like isoform X2 [Macadamia integrifolia]
MILTNKKRKRNIKCLRERKGDKRRREREAIFTVVRAVYRSIIWKDCNITLKPCINMKRLSALGASSLRFLQTNMQFIFQKITSGLRRKDQIQGKSNQAVGIKILASLSRKDVKRICGNNYPDWISFQMYEQVKWLNKELEKLSPFLAEPTSVIIRESIEPLPEEYRPPGITSLKFRKFSLGNVAPKIEGICVQSLKEDQITMDIDSRWGSNASIILDVKAAVVASLPVQLKNLQIYAIVRVIFQLAEELPCISAVLVAFLAEVDAGGLWR